LESFFLVGVAFASFSDVRLLAGPRLHVCFARVCLHVCLRVCV
jgi:hypothetical protein